MSLGGFAKLWIVCTCTLQTAMDSAQSEAKDRNELAIHLKASEEKVASLEGRLQVAERALSETSSQLREELLEHKKNAARMGGIAEAAEKEAEKAKASLSAAKDRAAGFQEQVDQLEVCICVKHMHDVVVCTTVCTCCRL